MGIFFKSMNETKDFPWIVRGHYVMSKFCFDCHNNIITWIYFIFSFFLVGLVCQNQLRKRGVLCISLFIIEKRGFLNIRFFVFWQIFNSGRFFYLFSTLFYIVFYYRFCISCQCCIYICIMLILHNHPLLNGGANSNYLLPLFMFRL